MSTLASSLEVLREKPFRHFFIGRSISKLGSSLTPLALTFGILGLEGTGADVGFVLGAGLLPQLLLLLFGGVVGDRFERRLILVGSDVVMGGAQAVSAFLLVTGRAEIIHLAALQFLVGAADAFFNPASSGAIRDFVGASRVQEARSLLGISGSSIRIVGPAIAGVIIAISNAGIALALDAASFFVSAWILSRVRVGFTPLEFKNSIKSDLIEGWKEVASRSWIWGYILFACVFQATALPVLQILGPLIARDSLGGASGWAFLLSAQSAGTFISGFILLKWKPKFPMRAAVTLCLFTLPFIVVLAIPNVQLAWLLLPAIVWGATLPMGDNLWFVALAAHVPDQAQSRVSSYDWLGSLALAPAGFWLMGHLASALPASQILLTVAAINLVCGLLLFGLRGIRQLERLQS